MQSDTLYRDTWAVAAEAAGLRLEELAVLTGKSYSSVYRYKTGTRTPSPEWLSQVAVLVRSRRLQRPTGGTAA